MRSQGVEECNSQVCCDDEVSAPQAVTEHAIQVLPYPSAGLLHARAYFFRAVSGNQRVTLITRMVAELHWETGLEWHCARLVFGSSSRRTASSSEPFLSWCVLQCEGLDELRKRGYFPRFIRAHFAII